MRLIDVDNFEKYISSAAIRNGTDAGRKIANLLIEVIDELPTVEAKEVVHAKWEECAWVEFDGIHCGVYTYPNGGLACSNCRHAFKKELLCPDNFCPNCGADMRTSAE